ncbi:protein Skeletor, isoforms B/C-like [Limulus polyphemus]|uniref:Protein Skeletor, isoforms B/C-like n=1 Tax=Limulus polyphemus TaxID=6850 RepID=A0ABM1BAU9_LIMPO|nr:protein Skeletor, isoforms B/C-like [Limulus polyphemus]
MYAFFWAGSTDRPDPTGFIIPDENGLIQPLKAYSNQNLVLKLPDGKTLKDIRWLAVWCRKFRANFGDIYVDSKTELPKSAKIGPLTHTAHGVSSEPIMVMDAQTFIVPNFKYDGQGPAAYWWVSSGSQQNGLGTQLTDEKNSEAPLKRYNGKTVVISLPDDKTIYDYDWFGVWCEEFSVDFGHVRIPHDIRVPPSLHLLGVKSENKLNCEILQDGLGLELRWVMDGGDTVMQLVGRIGDGDYMAFGLSKDDSRTEMVNADVIVTWIDSGGQGHAEDYFLASKEQCVGTHGSCPDQKYPGANNSVTLLNAATVNGYKMITFRRPQIALDKEYDQNIYSDGPQAVLWAIGPINNRGEVSYHKLRTDGNMFIDFARAPKWNCPVPAGDSEYSSTNDDVETVSELEGTQYASSNTEVENRAWEIPSIVCPANRTFYAQIGPTGGKKGYQGITGQVGWGIAWYINGLIIPEITVQRGKTYTFYVEGGNDPENPARHHPLYITESPEGGFEYKTKPERRREKVFAGVKRSRRGPHPTAAGRLCEWKIPVSQEEPPESYSTFAEFQQTLKLDCAQGEPAVLKWTPNERTPNLVYYQCYTHRYLGWKIHVVDSCDETFQPAASTLRVYNSNNEQVLQGIKPKTSLTKLEKPNTAFKTNGLPLFEASDDVISPEINFTGNRKPGISHEQVLHHELYAPSYQLHTQEKVINNETEYNISHKDKQSATHDVYSVPQRDTSSTGYNLQQSSFLNKPYSVHGDVTKNASVKEEQYVYYIPVGQLNRDFPRAPVQASHLSTFSSRSSEPQTGSFFLDNSKHISHHINKNKKRQLEQNAPVIKFEGGFRPILTSYSEDRFPDPTTPPPNDPRPFPLSEHDSVPFHGAFKPGEPDFSGFGVSKFGQAVAALPNVHSNIEINPQQTEIFRKPVLPPSSVQLPSAEERSDAHLPGTAHFSQKQQQEQPNYGNENDQEVTNPIVAASQLSYMYAAQDTGGKHNHGKETSENIPLKHSLNTSNQDDLKSQHNHPGAYELSVNDEKDVSQLTNSDELNLNPQPVGHSEDISENSYSGSYYQLADIYSDASSTVEETQGDTAEESYDHYNNEFGNHEVQLSTKKSNRTLTEDLYLYPNSYNPPTDQQSTAKYGHVETLQLHPTYVQSSEEDEKNGSDYNILSQVMDLINNPVINHDQLGSEDNPKSVVRRSTKLL